MEEGRRRPTSNPSMTMPLFSRLDHLDFIMKYLERKSNSQRMAVGNGNGNGFASAIERQCVPLDTAVKDAYFRGSLLDRVASLEHRLFQLRLELDSSCSSYPLSRASTQTSGESSSTQGSKGDVSFSLPTFNSTPNQAEKGTPQLQTNILQVHEMSQKVLHKHSNPSPPNTHLGKNGAIKDEKKSKGGKQRKSSSWPHLKILGC